MADAGEVGNRIERRGGLEPQDEFVGEFARRAAGAVGDADKVRVDFFQVPNRCVELVLRLRRLRWEELEGYGRLAGLENVADVHGYLCEDFLTTESSEDTEKKRSWEFMFFSPLCSLCPLWLIIFYQPRIFAKIKGATMVASDSMMNFGVCSPSLPQVIFSLGTAPE